MSQVIVDDNCYLDGIDITLDQEIFNKHEYVLVFGARGIGKSVFSKAMSAYDTGVLYISFQSVNYIFSFYGLNGRQVCNRAKKIIVIKQGLS